MSWFNMLKNEDDIKILESLLKSCQDLLNTMPSSNLKFTDRSNLDAWRSKVDSVWTYRNPGYVLFRDKYMTQSYPQKFDESSTNNEHIKMLVNDIHELEVGSLAFMFGADRAHDIKEERKESQMNALRDKRIRGEIDYDEFDRLAWEEPEPVVTKEEEGFLWRSEQIIDYRGDYEVNQEFDAEDW